MGTGSPITGSVVCEATTPARWAAPPAAAMITFSPRAAAIVAYWRTISGVRWALITRTSYGTPNSSRAAAAALIFGQSLSLPITMPTRGEVASGMKCAPGYFFERAG